MIARRAHAQEAAPTPAGRAARQPGPFRKKTAKVITPDVRAKAQALLASGASEAQVMRRTRLSREQVQRLVRAFERQQDAKLAALVREGLVSSPDLPREPLPDPVRVAGGLGATVLSDRR